jgi:ATP-binding cassette subfamily B (MDR/TAP) protein 1
MLQNKILANKAVCSFACVAFLFWWGGYLLFHHPDEFSFEDFLVSNFSLLFALFGLGSALQGISDRKEAETSAGRIFYLLDRQSEIDPLSKEGKTLD